MEKELEDFIKKASKGGISPEQVKNLLEQAGWNNSEIEEGLDRFKLIDFVKKAKEKGVSTDKIRESLLGSGWDKEEINDVLKKELHFPKINFGAIVKPTLMLLVLIGLVFAAWYILPSISFSFQKTSHHLDLSHIEFNESLYNTNIDSYTKNISKYCGSKNAIITGNIIGDSNDFSDTNISSNIGSLKVNYINSSGGFSLEINCVGEMVLNFNKKGFVPLHRRVFFDDGSNYLSILLVKENDFESFNTSSDFNVEDNAISLHFSKDSFDSAQNIKVSLTPFDSINQNNMSYFPGKSNALDVNGNPVGIESFGFFKIKVEDLNGRGLSLINNKTINGSLKINDKQKRTAPKQISLWNFNEKLGTWVYVGETVKRCENECYYDFVLEKVGSWFSASVPTNGGAKLSISGFDYSAPKNRVDVASSSIVPKTVDLKAGETIENLDKVKTSMVCTKDEISGYDRKLIADSGTEIIMDFHLSGFTTTYYFGRGISQVIKDSTGRVVREIETECVCTEEETWQNRYLFDCDGYTANGTYFDGCNRESVSFSCESKKAKNCSYSEVPSVSCNGDHCSVCKGEKVVYLKKGTTGFCEEESGADCSKQGMICVEHVTESDGDSYASCDCPSSLTFLTSLNSFLNQKDGNKFVPAFGRLGGFKSENTFKTLKDTKSTFNKITNYCRSSCDKSIDVIFVDHGGGWGQRVGMDYIEKTSLQSDVKPLIDAGIYDFSCVSNIVFGGCSVGECDFLQDAADVFDTRTHGGTITIYRGPEGDQLEERLPWYWDRYIPLPGIRRSATKQKTIDPAELLNLKNYNNKWRGYPTYTGYATIGISSDEDMSIVGNVDTISGGIHYLINDFVYYSELSGFRDKLFGDLVIYDSFIIEKDGIYSIGTGDGVFALIDNNSIINKEGSIIEIEGEDYYFEFKEKIGDIYMITKKRLIYDEIEINYLYSDGKLVGIQNGEENIVFNYDKNKLTYIIYNHGEENYLIEEFIYNEDKLSQVLYKKDGEVFSKINYTRNSDSFEIRSEYDAETYLLDGNRVEKIEVDSMSIKNTSGYTVNFEYDDDYTYITSDNYTTTCYRGLCFIDELTNSITTSPKCLDYYPNHSKVNDFDNFILRVQGIDSSGGFVWKEINIDRNKIDKLIEIEIPSSANLSVFLELNGVPSNPINFISGNNILNISSLLNPPKNCNNVGISFGGFSLENCKIYSGDLDKLIKCLVGSAGMFDATKQDLIIFLEELETSENIRKGAISLLEERFN